MTVKKAIKIMDWWINQKTQSMQQLVSEWNHIEDDKGIAKILLDSDKITILNLELIKKELFPYCSHPIKMRDRGPDEIMYCMNCNSDL